MNILSAAPAQAADVWTLVPGRTTVGFSIKHFMLLNVNGSFKSYTGTVTTPGGDDFSHASVDVSIPVSSVFTGNSDRDEHLKQPEFFDASGHPNIRFRSTKVTQSAANRFEMHGELTIRGISKPVVLEVEQLRIKALKNGSVLGDFVATGTVNRYDYGLRWNELTEAGALVVGDNVDITLKVSLQRAGAPETTQKIVDLKSAETPSHWAR